MMHSIGKYISFTPPRELGHVESRVMTAYALLLAPFLPRLAVKGRAEVTIIFRSSANATRALIAIAPSAILTIKGQQGRTITLRAGGTEQISITSHEIQTGLSNRLTRWEAQEDAMIHHAVDSRIEILHRRVGTATEAGKLHGNPGAQIREMRALRPGRHGEDEVLI